MTRKRRNVIGIDKIRNNRIGNQFSSPRISKMATTTLCFIKQTIYNQLNDAGSVQLLCIYYQWLQTGK